MYHDMTQKDYQWPSSFLNDSKHDKVFSSNSNKKVFNKIEDFFSQYYGCYVCLMPSGRSSISILLRYLNFDRSKTVFISKWSSNCLYSCIGPYCNISSDFVDPDLILVNHKWGYKSDFHKDFLSKIIIEDSVDTIHTDNSALFHNNGIAEIISLPKIIGSFSGGLILTKDQNLSEYIKSMQQDNLELGIIQSKKKREAIIGIKNDWGCHEHINTSLDIAALNNIENNMHNLYKNINVISHRREEILEKFSNMSIDLNRLGPVIVFPKSQYRIESDKTNFMVRQFDYSLKIDSTNCYQSSYLLPVHFRILDRHFRALLDAIFER